MVVTANDCLREVVRTDAPKFRLELVVAQRSAAEALSYLKMCARMPEAYLFDLELVRLGRNEPRTILQSYSLLSKLGYTDDFYLIGNQSEMSPQMQKVLARTNQRVLEPKDLYSLILKISRSNT